jgi:hypothetical protein
MRNRFKPVSVKENGNRRSGENPTWPPLLNKPAMSGSHPTYDGLFHINYVTTGLAVGYFLYTPCATTSCSREATV